MLYKFIWDSAPGEPRWEVSVELADDLEAKTWGRAVIGHSAACRIACLALRVWRCPTDARHECIADLRLDHPNVRDNYER